MVAQLWRLACLILVAPHQIQICLIMVWFRQQPPKHWVTLRTGLVTAVILAYGAGTANATSATPEPAGANQGNNLNQSVINGFTGNVNLGQNAQHCPLIIGNQYTEDYQITLERMEVFSRTNTLYAGVGTGGAILGTNYAVASGGNTLTTNLTRFANGGNPHGSALKSDYKLHQPDYHNVHQFESSWPLF